MPAPWERSSGDDLEEALNFALGERGGRFVEDQNLRLGADGFGDLDDLLLGHAEGGDARVRIDGCAGAFEDLAGLALARFPIDATPDAAGFEAEGDVFGDGEIGKERGLLVDDGDAEVVRLDRVVALDRGSLDAERAGIVRDGAGDDLDERGFPRAILAHKGVDFAGLKIKGNVLQRAHTRVGFRNADGFEEHENYEDSLFEKTNPANSNKRTQATPRWL